MKLIGLAVINLTPQIQVLSDDTDKGLSDSETVENEKINMIWKQEAILIQLSLIKSINVKFVIK